MQKECDTTAIKSGDKTRGSGDHFKDDQFIYEIKCDTQNKTKDSLKESKRSQNSATNVAKSCSCHNFTSQK